MRKDRERMCVCMCAHKFVLRMEELYVYVVLLLGILMYISAHFAFEME